MVDDRDNPSLGTSVPDVANLGLVRPPFVYVGSIALGLVLHLLWPTRLIPSSVSTQVGAIVMVLAIALFVSAVRTLRSRHADPRQPPHHNDRLHGGLPL